MPFTSLANRINQLPLLLCGPILRRVEADSVTVWVALKEEKKVWLEVYENVSGPESLPDLKKILTGDRLVIRLGEHLFLVAVTATLVPGTPSMTPGKLYFYNLFFTAKGATQASPGDTNLTSNGVIHFDIHYAHEPEDLDPDHSTHIHLPSFCLAPVDLNKLRIVHGSCRKAHAEGLDAMPAVDDMILSDRVSPLDRPHYLLLTGDQFYADDVSPIMLHLLMDAEKSLFGSVEDLPEIGKPALADSQGNNGNFLPEKRKDQLEGIGKFTSGENNHLATAGEYIAFYLFMWSDVLWDTDFPDFNTVFKGQPGNITNYNRDLDSLKKFKDSNYHVKRAMANVPTYMIFDDHDVTDDWYMTYDWCERTLSNDLGRRVILNGLLAYALFQAWGNTPEHYLDVDKQGNKTSGKHLLEAAEEWFKPGSKRENVNATLDKEPDLQKYLGIPLGKTSNLIFVKKTDYHVLNQDVDALKWDFIILRDTYEIKVLDGRTRRGYPDHTVAPRGKQAHPDIISEESLLQQFSDVHNPPRDLSIVVAPTSVISIPAIELSEFPWFVRMVAESTFKKKVYEFDIFDHWRNQSRASEKLLAFLSKRNAPVSGTPNSPKELRVIILTGDVHFSAVSRMQYEYPEFKSLFAQLVSSSFKKQDIKTRLLHQHGYKFTNISALAFGSVFITRFPDLIAGIPVVGPILIIPLIWPLILMHIAFVMLDKLLKILDQTILKDWFDPKGVETRHFLGWEDPAKENINHLRIPIGSPGGLFNEIKLGIPTVLETKTLQAASEPKLKFPDWQYRIDFMTAANDVRAPAPYPNEPLVAPGPGDRKEALAQYLALAKNHMDYAKKWGNGKEIVGVNNISEVFFEWGETKKFARQESWWRLKGEDGELKLFPLSNYKVSLNFDDPEFPIPKLPKP